MGQGIGFTGTGNDYQRRRQLIFCFQWGDRGGLGLIRIEGLGAEHRLIDWLMFSLTIL